MATFDPAIPRLASDNPAAIAFYFSPDAKISSNRFMACAMTPESGGYLHKFVTIRDIDNILIVSNFELNNESSRENLESRFCNMGFNGRRLGGIGTFFPTGDVGIGGAISATSEFLLCSTQNLKYIGTRRCEARNQLSQEYDFTRSNVGAIGYPASVMI